MGGNKIIKSVSFNITNENDKKMLKAIKRRNFSGYVKKLLLADIDKKEKRQSDESEGAKKEGELTASEKMEVIRDKLNRPKN
ncbi:hypothetical protein [Lentibacillus sp. Marseille-P4043]|uniref:hypothetical protein n=1 Tax=Lentibacillus sp. Marseille-P4043 TaxID=2040293 RepID=UPI000D0BB144|nr:hypothetical protein [Lentibacillus sp. Marseille-P4043]